MVLRALWIFGGGVPADRTVEDEDKDEDVLLPGPQTLIFALPDAADGDEMKELGDFTMLPVMRERKTLFSMSLIITFFRFC